MLIGPFLSFPQLWRWVVGLGRWRCLTAHLLPPHILLLRSNKPSFVPLPDHCHELRSAFQLIDADGDGHVSRSDLHHHLGKLGLGTNSQVTWWQSLSAPAVMSFDQFKLFYDTLCERCATTPGCHADSGTSCHVDNSTSQEAAAGDDVLPDAFAVFDVDGDGKISVAELQQVLVRMGFTQCHDEAFCHGIMSSFDTNFDGFIDLHEFTTMMTQPPHT